MDAGEMKRRRKALGLTQGDLAKAIGLHRNSIGLMEREAAPIEPRTADAVRSLKPASLAQVPICTDPMEREIERALIDASIRFTTDRDNETALDFHLTDLDISIEVKRFYTARTGEQMARALNVIVAQGERAVRFLAQAIRSGDFILMIHAEKDERPAKDRRGAG